MMNISDRIHRDLPGGLSEILDCVRRSPVAREGRVYLVGGAVRDALLGCSISDLDLVVEGDAVALAQRVASDMGAKVVAHPRFGTAKIGCEGLSVDFAGGRGESYSRPGALPSVWPGTLNDDLRRRDFSVNAMAVCLGENGYGDLIDPCGGQHDVVSRLIRVLHGQSFRDDATRIVRAIRYEQRLGFELESETGRLLERDLPMLDSISGDRLRHELESILGEGCPELAISRLGSLGALERICPPLKGNGWLVHVFREARKWNTVGKLSTLYLCLLCYRMSESEVEAVTSRLRVPGKVGRAVRQTVLLRGSLPALCEPNVRPSDIDLAVRGYEVLAIEANAIAAESAVAREGLIRFLRKLRYVRPSLNGEALKRLGVPQGVVMGMVLEELRRAKLDGEVGSRADEERLVASLRLADHESGSQWRSVPR